MKSQVVARAPKNGHPMFVMFIKYCKYMKSNFVQMVVLKKICLQVL